MGRGILCFYPFSFILRLKTLSIHIIIKQKTKDMRTQDFVVDKYRNLPFVKLENVNQLKVGMMIQITDYGFDPPEWKYLEVTKENINSLLEGFIASQLEGRSDEVDDYIRIPCYVNTNIIIKEGEILNDYILITKNDFDYYRVKKTGYYLVDYKSLYLPVKLYIWYIDDNDKWWKIRKYAPGYYFGYDINDIQKPIEFLNILHYFDFPKKCKL